MVIAYGSRADGASYTWYSRELHRNTIYCNRNVIFEWYGIRLLQLYPTTSEVQISKNCSDWSFYALSKE